MSFQNYCFHFRIISTTVSSYQLITETYRYVPDDLKAFCSQPLPMSLSFIRRTFCGVITLNSFHAPLLYGYDIKAPFEREKKGK